MKNALLLTILTLAIVLPLQADERERHQSYISYDDGGTVIRSGEDGKQVDAHRNLPVYPGDEVITARRGRAEIHLSDGNIIGIDRETALQFRSILDSYEGDADETVAVLRYGKVAIQRTDIGRDRVRLDTDNASYVANREAIYSVETDKRGRDRVIVFEGSVEVRTPNRSSRLRAGEAASVDDRGVFDLVGDQRHSADDFERWFLKRADHSGSYTSRYMDRRLSYWNDDLDDHGRWVFVTGIGWSWRPFVTVGWRPYYNGYWHHRNGCLTWVSYDPWGWGTYHYGRWAFDPGYGWVWVPGYGYSPAWVYWAYGPGYIGWAPSGWWDCHRGYYDWAYRPYRHAGVNLGFGFYGRVRGSEIDLRPWTFIDPNTVASTRIDRAALTTDAIKQRLGRGNGGFTTISGSPARFTREQLRDPAEAIRRRGLGNDAGIEAGTPADLTPFIRRDGQISAGIRDRIVSSRGGSNGSGTTTSRNIGGGSVAPIGGGNVAPIGRGGLAPIGGGSVAPITGGSGGDNNRSSDGRITRGGSGSTGSESPSRDSRPPVRVIGGERDDNNDTQGSGRSTGWRDRTGSSDRPRVTAPPETVTPDSQPDTSRSSGGDSWRRRVRTEDTPASATPPSGSGESTSRGSDVPRRVIEGIGGARVVPRDRDSSSRDSGSSSGSGSRDTSTRSRDTSSRGSGDRPARVQSGSGSSGGSSRSSGSSGSSTSSDKPSGSSGSSNNNSGNRESGGRIKRDQ